MTLKKLVKDINLPKKSLLHSRVVPITDSILYPRKSEVSTITNVFVKSLDDIMLILLLMYTTIIIIMRLIIGLSYCPTISPQRRTSHTRANED